MKIKVQIKDQTFEVEVGDLNVRPITAVVDGETFEVWPASDVAPVAAPPQPVRAAVPVVAPSTPAPAPAPTPKVGS